MVKRQAWNDMKRKKIIYIYIIFIFIFIPGQLQLKIKESWQQCILAKQCEICSNGKTIEVEMKEGALKNNLWNEVSQPDKLFCYCWKNLLFFYWVR